MASRTRLSSLRLIVSLLILAAASFAADMRYLVYVGTYTDKGSKGIYNYRFDPQSGELGAIELVATTANPSFLAVDLNYKYLYAVNEVDSFQGEHAGAVSA